MYFHYRVLFTGYIHNTRCFVLLRRMTLWPWPLTFRPWECFIYSASRVRPTIFIILRFSVTELWINEFDHISVIRHSHCACAMSHDLSSGGEGAKMVHILEIPDPNLPIHFVSFRALRRRLSHVIGENSVYPIVKATKFTAHAQYHVTWA